MAIIIAAVPSIVFLDPYHLCWPKVMPQNDAAASPRPV
eukprot:CAMPEP_0169271358 /NCGR_PEP_ID=MMETSP1016-20121227/49710_1 /TAXON_ID=342587 /ORGANISM="Karlodinium micrum, Strain CCMP2283" /LENGTH=37 /DNA_ID= /DNA_START= /DNA_END= /DNA_ORIENTATION=